MTSSMRHLFKITLTLMPAVAVSACVFTRESPYVVNAGDSTPVDQREDGTPFDRILDLTPIVAFEAGRCESDADCVPQGCDNAVCAAQGTTTTCVVDRVSACLAEVSSSSCGCTDEGVCRWTRTNEVLYCARIMNDVSETRSYEGAIGEAYPWRPYY